MLYFRLVYTGAKNPTPEEAAHLEWRACDADGGYTALMTAGSARGDVAVNLVISTVASAPWPPSGWRLYGDEGTLLAEGFSSFTVSRLSGAGADRELLPVPQRLLDELPSLGADETNRWAALAGDFVADVREEAHRPYLTFRDGWRYQEAFDAIRAGRGWYTLPA